MTGIRLALVPHAVAPAEPIDPTEGEPAAAPPVVPPRREAHDADAVYRELAPAVLGYLRAQRVLEPEDVLGEVFLHVARDLGRFRGDGGELRRWVFSIAHNRMVDSWRRRTVRPVTADVPIPEEAVLDPALDGVDDELVAALAGLTRSQRDVLVLRFVADLPLQDVARITHRPLTAVKALQRRGLAQLRSALSGVDPRT